MRNSTIFNRTHYGSGRYSEMPGIFKQREVLSSAAVSIVRLDFMRLKKIIFILQAVQQQHPHPGSPHRQPKPWRPPKSSKCAGTPLRRRPETRNRWFGTAAQCAPVFEVLLWKERRKCVERTEGRHEGNVVCLILRDRFARIEND